MKKENVVIFGASRLGKLAKEYLEIDYNIIAFCDNDKNKLNTKFENVEVISPEILKKVYDDKSITIVIASMYYNEISKQLVKMGIYKQDIKIYQSNVMSYTENMENKIKINMDLQKFEVVPKKIKKTNVHLMVDNVYCNKFIEIVNKNFDLEENVFIIYSFNVVLKYVNKKEYKNVYHFSVINDEGEIILKLLNCNKLFIHYFDDTLADMMIKYNVADIVRKIYWIPWGGDFYPYLKLDLFEPRTKELKNSLESEEEINCINLNKEKIIEKIDYILTGTEGDFKLIKKRFNAKAKLKWLRYNINVDIDYLLSLASQTDCTIKQKLKIKNIIWLGNSASYENNHLDIMYKLKEMDNEEFGIICPLSYGNQHYKTQIVNIGTELFKDRFIPLLDFIEGKEYFKLMNQADVIIMNHIRQQAEGNILGALYLGKKVYLNSKSTVYDYYTSNKINIFKSEDIQSLEELFNLNINKDRNISILKNILNDEKIESTINELMSEK